jgi:hypothetical protein
VTSQFELISLLFHVHTGLLGRTKVVITHLSECKKMEELRDRVIKNYFNQKDQQIPPKSTVSKMVPQNNLPEN